MYVILKLLFNKNLLFGYYRRKLYVILEYFLFNFAESLILRLDIL